MLNFFQAITSLQRDVVYVVFELSQSNGGQAEADRLTLTEQISLAGLGTYSGTPNDCKIWYKPDMNMTDDGSMQNINAGVNTSQYTFARTFGAEISACPRLRDRGNNTCYYIKAMKGGTPLYQQAGDDWNASSVNELLDSALDVYATPALQQIKIDYPDKQIKVILLRHQGESDNTTTERDAYYQNSLDFLAKIRAYQIDGVSYFADAPFVDVLLYYQPLESQEQLMNDIKIQFAAEQPNCYVININNQPRKIDLTTAQKGGISPTLTDNEHTSYLGQLEKGEQLVNLITSIGY